MVLDGDAADRGWPAAYRQRPAKRGLGAKSLDDLRTIPWVFSWSQARINLAAWYGLGTACEKLDDLDLLRRAYAEWPLFSTFIDNIEMSIAKTDGRIAKMYLALGDRDDLASKVFEEMQLTRKWTLAITGDDWPLQVVACWAAPCACAIRTSMRFRLRRFARCVRFV